MIDGPERHLMVVDDEDSVRILIRTIFEPQGWKVTEATGGIEALRLLREPPFPDVVLLDLMMPGLDGLAVLGELRGSRCAEHVPIVILSTGGPLSARLAGSLGADDCITKPFDHEALRLRCAVLAARVHADQGATVDLPEAQLQAS